ncbi:MAG: AAA family ATPase [bacterium]|nr:AAA family ATPase [bacterium]
MTMAKRPAVTRLRHALPFEQLSPFDFERLCLWLVHREGYECVEHLGAAGRDRGRDIVARRDGRRVIFQCKRVQRLDPAAAEREIDKLKALPEEDQPNDIIFVVSSSVSGQTRDRARSAWNERGACDFWAGSELDERAKRHADILHEFFDLGARESVAKDPLLGLPKPSERDLPPSPFKHLHWFERDDTEIFFGRGQEIRKLYESVTFADGPPIVLLFGATGVGKTSLLGAGLQPRLEADYDTVFVRLERDRSLVETLLVGIGGADKLTDPAGAWRSREQATGLPLVVLLDQLEQAWTRPLPSSAAEVEKFAAVLRALFATRDLRPQGRLVLAFRKEWLAEVLGALDTERLPRTQVEVLHLGPLGIAEAVAGPSRAKRLRLHYGLTVDPEVVTAIVTDLAVVSPAAGSGSPKPAQVAPVLQILLSKLWIEAKKVSPSAPRFTLDLYRQLERRGILLDDFLGESLAGLRSWRPSAERSGLALDLLLLHTTKLGTAQTRRAANVLERYGQRQEVAELIQQCIDRYLLIGTARVQKGELLADSDDSNKYGTTCLAHDTLAPLVRRRFEASDRSGQRARRILAQRALDWREGAVGPVLDETDLKLVLAGAAGMRKRTVDEERLVKASLTARTYRASLRLTLATLGAVAVAAIVITGWFAWVQNNNAQRSIARIHVQEGIRRLDQGNGSAALASFASAIRYQPRDPVLRAHVLDLLVTMGRPKPSEPLQHSTPVVVAKFSPDGRRLATVSEPGGVHLWDAVTGDKIGVLHGPVATSVEFNSGSSQVVTASWDQSAQIFDAETGAKLGPPLQHNDVVNYAEFSPDGLRVVTASFDGTAQLWDAETGTAIGPPLEPGSFVASAKFSPDGQRLVTASWNGTTQVWHLEAEPQKGPTIRPGGAVKLADFSPNGVWIVTASSGDASSGDIVQVWNAESGAALESIAQHGKLSSVTFSPDSRRIVTASSDRSAQMWEIGLDYRLNTKSQITIKKMGRSLPHGGPVHYAEFSPDGRYVVTASEDNTSQVWNAENGAAVGLPLRHAGAVRAAKFSPDGRQVVTASEDGTAQVWDVVVGEKVGLRLGGHRSLVSADFSPDSDRLLTAALGESALVWNASSGERGPYLRYWGRLISATLSGDGRRAITLSSPFGSGTRTIQAWNTKTGEEIRQGFEPDRLIKAVEISPDGERIATAYSNNSVRTWHTETAEPAGLAARYSCAVESLEFSWDGQHLAYICANRGKGIVHLSDVDSGERRRPPLEHTGLVRTARFAPDSRRIVTASQDGTAQVWEVKTGNALGPRFHHSDTVNYAEFSPDGERIVTASLDETAQVWDVETGKSLGPPLRHLAGVNAASFSPDGSRVVTASNDNTAQMWDSDTREKIGEPFEHDAAVTSAIFSSDGQQILTATAGGTAYVWNAQIGDIVSSMGPVRGAARGPNTRLRTVEFSADGGLILLTDKEKILKIWDLDNGESVDLFLEHGGDLKSAEFSPDGQRVVTVSTDGSVQAWNAETGQNVCVILKELGEAVSTKFSKDGLRVVTASSSGNSQVWDAETGSEVSPVLVHADGVRLAEFSPDSRRVLTASKKTAQVWDATTGAKLGPPLQGSDVVFDARFSPDGQQVLTASKGGEAQIWDWKTGGEISSRLRHDSDVISVDFSPDGRRVATASLDTTAQVWDARTGEKVGLPLHHQDHLNFVIFDPGGHRVVTASQDKTAQVWDAETGYGIGPPLRHDAGVISASFSPDGRRLATLTRSQRVLVWETPVGQTRNAKLLADSAEASAGYFITDLGVVAPVTARASQLRATFSAAAGGGGGSESMRILEWYFSHPWGRRISPFSPHSVPEFILRFPEQAKHRFPGHPIVRRCVWPITGRSHVLEFSCIRNELDLLEDMDVIRPDDKQEFLRGVSSYRVN